MLKTQSLYSKTESKIEHRLSLKTCKTKGQFVKIAEVIVTQDSKVSVILESEMEKVLPEVDLQKFLSVQNCDLERSNEKISRIVCKSSDLVISKNERIQFDEVSYVQSRDPLFIARGVMYKNDEPKLKVTLEIDRENKVTPKVEEIKGQN